MEPGKCYEITRATGTVIRFKLLKYVPERRRLEMMDLSTGSLRSCDHLTDAELESIKPILPDEENQK